MLMSAEGRREFQAAQAPTIRGRTQHVAYLDDAAHFGEEAGRSTALPQVNLEELWLQNSGVPYDPSELESTTVATTDDFEFGSDDVDIDIDTPPRHGGGRVGGERFRVDRPPPQRPQFVARPPEPGPQGGPMREAGRVGRFAILREEGGRPEPAPPPRAPQQATRVAHARPSALEQSRAMQSRQKLPNIYDRIREGFLDDD